jgi:sulfoxide reductase heme-binding subunit YedZ
MLWRLLPGKWGGFVGVLPGLGIAAAALAALVEFAWYDIATHVSAWRVLMANERFALMRPAHWVLVSGGAIFALALLRRIWTWTAGLRRNAGTGMLRARQS